MYNAKAVILGIVIFVAIFSSPFWTSWIGKDYTNTGVVLHCGGISVHFGSILYSEADVSGQKNLY
jgi:hypothetical protein